MNFFTLKYIEKYIKFNYKVYIDDIMINKIKIINITYFILEKINSKETFNKFNRF